jgi:hypothetical protein
MLQFNGSKKDIKGDFSGSLALVNYPECNEKPNILVC